MYLKKIVLFIGEKSSATVPSYYFTKPLGKGMKNLLQEKPQPSPVDTPDPYNTSNTVSANVFDNDNDNEVVPKIRMIVKKVFLRRAPSRPGSKSPWCRSTKRRYKKVIIYIDEFGNEIPQDKEEENKDEDEEENEMAEGVGKEEEEEEEDAKEADKENINDNDCEMTENTIAKDSINRSPRGRRRGDSPRTRSNPTSPRAGKSPGEDKSPVGSSHSPDDQSKEDDIIKSGDERPRSKERKDDCMSLESTTRTRVCKSPHEYSTNISQYLCSSIPQCQVFFNLKLCALYYHLNKDKTHKSFLIHQSAWNFIFRDYN